MPQLLFLAIIGGAGLAGYKLLSTLVRQAAHEPKREKAPPGGTSPNLRDLGDLEWDESQGVYRPHRDRES